MNKSEAKKQLRSEMRRMAQSLSAQYLQYSGEAILAHLCTLSEYKTADTVFCFVGTAGEVDTLPLLKDALCAGKRVCVPRCVGSRQMDLCAIFSPDQLAPGAYGILEPPADAPRISPDDVDFAVIPCVTCDREGHRLGHGGGYYDAFLASYRASAVLICRESLMHSEIPMEPHDSIVHWVITERGLYEDGVPAPMA